MNDRIKIIALSAALNIMPLAAFAQYTDPCQLLNNLFTIVKIFGNVVLVVAVFILLYAGFLFLTGGGNDETLKKAKTILVFGLIGLAVALLATSADDLLKVILPQWQLLTQCTVQ